MLPRLFFIEIRKTLKHPALWLGLASLLLLLAAFTLISHLQVAYGYREASGGLEKDVLSGLAFYNWISVLIYAVTGSVIVAFDYPDRSVQLWLMRGVSRPVLLFARLLTTLCFGLAIVCFTVAALIGLGAISRTLLFGIVDASNLNVSALLPAILRIFWCAIPYLALTVLFAVVSRSPLFAAGATIVYGSVIELLAVQASDRFPNLVRYLPISLSQVLQTFNLSIDRATPRLFTDTAIRSEMQATIIIGILFITISALSFTIFSRQDLGG